MVTVQVRGGRGGGGGFRLRNLGLIFGEEKERRKSFYGGENPQRRDYVLTGAEGTMLEAEGARRRRKGNLNKKAFLGKIMPTPLFSFSHPLSSLLPFLGA